MAKLWDILKEAEPLLHRCPCCNQKVIFTQDSQCLEDVPENDNQITIRISHLNKGAVQTMCLGFSIRFSDTELNIMTDTTLALRIGQIVNDWNNECEEFLSYEINDYRTGNM